MIGPSVIMYSINLYIAIIIGFCTQMILSECPRLCECKWKSGKESVSCPNANLSSIPLHLEAGTQVIDLSNNNLATIKNEEFAKAGLINLQKVYIVQCKLKTLEKGAFRKLTNLVELDLSHNFLSSVPSHTFDGIPELRELKLINNPIQRIPNDAFIHIPQLNRLELSDCRINSIEPRAFDGLEESLEWVKLDHNKLSEVIASSFTILQNLHGLELAGNPWNCSCSLRPLRAWMLQQNVPFGIPPICQNPKRLRSKAWDKLDLDEFACVPEIFAYESKTKGVEGKNVTMTCRITGIPEPSVRWLLKNKVITNLTGFANGKKLYMVHLQNNSSDLTIFSADLQDAGVYVCAAENKAGRVEASVTLAVIRKPPEPSFSNKILLASVITGVALVLASCLIALCIYSVRKKQMVVWRTRECHREDNYEKIEMNHQNKVGGNSNGGTVPAEIAVVAAKKNGEYSVVPVADNEEEEEEVEGAKKEWCESVVEKRWNSPEHLLDPDDLHIPRRTIQEVRDNNLNSTCGTFSQPSTSIPFRRQLPTTYTTTFNQELSSLAEDEVAKKYPDLLENSSYKFNKANSEGGSVSDIAELFCTLPRKRALIQNQRYRSSDSQSPLLPESRYGSSGGESSGSQEGLRRLSDCSKYPIAKHRVNKISGSYLNLSRDDELTTTPTPLLDVSNLESRAAVLKRDFSPNANSYDYHAAQLEKFLEEYRTLQKQLTKMKETCDNLRQDHMQVNSPTPSTSDLRHNAISPNSNKSLEDSIDFRNFESELTKYLLAKTSPSPKSFNNGSGVLNN